MWFLDFKVFWFIWFVQKLSYKILMEFLYFKKSALWLYVEVLIVRGLLLCPKPSIRKIFIDFCRCYTFCIIKILLHNSIMVASKIICNVLTCCQFHQCFTFTFFVQNVCAKNYKTVFWLLIFWRQNFLQKTRTWKIDEIDGCRLMELILFYVISFTCALKVNT